MIKQDEFKKLGKKYNWEDRYDDLQEKIYKIGWCWKNWRKDKGGKHPKKIIKEFIEIELSLLLESNSQDNMYPQVSSQCL